MNIEYKPVSGQEQHSTRRYSLVNCDNNWMMICLVGSAILILDDLASHMTTANEAKEALKFLAEFLTTVKKSVHSSKVSVFYTVIHLHEIFVMIALLNILFKTLHQVCFVAGCIIPSVIWHSLVCGKKWNGKLLFPSLTCATCCWFGWSGFSRQLCNDVYFLSHRRIVLREIKTLWCLRWWSPVRHTSLWCLKEGPSLRQLNSGRLKTWWRTTLRI